MTKLIDRLVALDIVERKTNPDDRRILDITLTQHGKEIFAERKNGVAAAMREYVSSYR